MTPRTARPIPTAQPVNVTVSVNATPTANPVAQPVARPTTNTTGQVVGAVAQVVGAIARAVGGRRTGSPMMAQPVGMMPIMAAPVLATPYIAGVVPMGIPVGGPMGGSVFAPTINFAPTSTPSHHTPHAPVDHGHAPVDHDHGHGGDWGSDANDHPAIEDQHGQHPVDEQPTDLTPDAADADCGGAMQDAEPTVDECEPAMDDCEPTVEDVQPEIEDCGEPVFVPRSATAAEGDGFVLSVIFRGATQCSDLAVFDAQNLKDGPLALAHLSHRVPAGFHGNWRGAAG